jgi:hypothetical protein
MVDLALTIDFETISLYATGMLFRNLEFVQ